MCRRVMNLAFTEYRRFFSVKKLMIMAFSFILLYEDVVLKMINLSKELGFPLNKVEPYDLLLSYNIHAMIIPLSFMFLIQGFPEYSTSSYYHISRMSRREWLAGETIYAVMIATTYEILLLAGTLLAMAGTGTWSTEWSPYMKELFYECPLEFETNNQLFMDASTVSQGNPVFVCFFSSMLMIIYMMVIAQVLMFFNMKNMKKIGFIISMVIIIAGSAAVEFQGNVKWFFPMAHAMYGTHFNGFAREPVMEIYKSIIYFGIIAAVMLVLNRGMVKKISIGDSDI